jgi:hypothetical protein
MSLLVMLLIGLLAFVRCLPSMSVSSRVEFLAKASRCLTKDEVDEVTLIGEVAKDLLQQRAQSFVLACGHRAVLYQYQGDGTPMLVRHRTGTKVGHKSIVHDAGSGREFLCQAAFLLSESELGEPISHAILHEPRILDGKTSWHLYIACKEFFPWLHKAGHRDGYNLQFFVYDRAPLSAVSRKVRQAHHLYWRAVQDAQTDSENILHENMSWTLFVGCSAHDCHNGCATALAPFVTQLDQLKDTHILIKSLRNGFSDLHLHMGRWLMQHVRWVPRSAETEEELEQYWAMLGMEPDVAQGLAERRVLFSNGYLEVWDACKEDASVVPFLSATLLMALQLRSFSEGRFLTMSSVMRNLIAAVSLGLQSLVEFTLGAPGVSHYYLGGATRLSPAILHYAVIAALASRPADRLLEMILDDDRVALHCDAYHSAFCEELMCRRIVGSCW